MERLMFILLAVAVISGCATPQKQVSQRQAPFIESEYAPYAITGTATIKGQAFTKTRGGDVKFAAGNMISMNPVTTYSTEWFNRNVLSGEFLSPSDTKIDPFNKTTIADGNGNFKFTNLPAGEYYIVTNIIWEVPSAPAGYLKPTGGILAQKVIVKDGETVEIILPTVRGF